MHSRALAHFWFCIVSIHLTATSWWNLLPRIYSRRKPILVTAIRFLFIYMHFIPIIYLTILKPISKSTYKSVAASLIILYSPHRGKWAELCSPLFQCARAILRRLGLYSHEKLSYTSSTFSVLMSASMLPPLYLVFLVWCFASSSERTATSLVYL
jgi:hypothetical protein